MCLSIYVIVNGICGGIAEYTRLLFRESEGNDEGADEEAARKKRINSIENTLVGKPPVGIEFKIFIVHSNLNMLLQKITEYKARTDSAD